MSWLPKLLSRLAALSLLVAAAAAVALFLVMPLVDRARALEDEIAFNGEMIERLSGSIENRGAYEAEIEGLTRRIAESGLYIRASTDALAAAAMQENLKREIAQYGGELRSIQNLPSEEEDGLVRIGLRVVMTGENDTAVQLLHALETGEPYLFVDNLQISTTAYRRRLVREEEENSAPLSLNFDIYGYLPPQEEG